MLNYFTCQYESDWQQVFKLSGLCFSLFSDMFQGKSGDTQPTNGKQSGSKQDTSAIITLRPNKQRTQGKKGKFDKCNLI